MQYEKINRPGVSRSFQNLSYEKQLNCDMGQLIPFYLEETLPGDKWSISNECVIRFQPLVAPIMQNVNVHFEYFFVPFRIMFDDWEDFLTGGVDGKASDSIELPLWDDYTDSAPEKYSLWDYFGLPLHHIPTINRDGVEDKSLIPLSFPRTAYNMIFNKYYRDETIDDEVDLNNNDVLYRRWKKDYFTSSLPFQQRGVAPAIGIGGQASLVGDLDFNSFSGSLRESIYPRFDSPESGRFTWTSPANAFYGRSSGAKVISFTPSGFDFSPSSAPDIDDRFGATSVDGYFNPLALRQHTQFNFEDIHSNVDLSGVKADLSNVPVFDIAQLRLANSLQLFLELNARAGYYYDDFLLAHFGYSPKSAVIQDPVFLGSSVAPLHISEVLQTSETTESSPQGRLSGRGIGLSTNKIDNFVCPENGLIIGLMSIVPSTMYNSQGIGKMWLRRSRFDYFFPEFAHLSEVPILEVELNLINGLEHNKEVFGYQGIYDEYRHRRSEVVADMRDKFDYWNISRKFTPNEPVVLNSNFLEMNPRKDIFAVKDEPGFIVDILNVAKALRPIPSFATPGGLRF